MVSEYNEEDGSSTYVTEEELDRRSDYFTELARLEYFGTDAEDLLEADDYGILARYEDDPEKVERDSKRFLTTAQEDRLPEQYQEKVVDAIAVNKLAQREALYRINSIEINLEEELQEIKEDLLNKLWTEADSTNS